MSSAICFNLDHSKILSSGNGLIAEMLIVCKISCIIFYCFQHHFIYITAARAPIRVFPEFHLPVPSLTLYSINTHFDTSTTDSF